MPAPNEKSTRRTPDGSKESSAITKEAVPNLAAGTPADPDAVKGGRAAYSGVACHKDPNPGDE